jgi:hypothetical protein
VQASFPYWVGVVVVEEGDAISSLVFASRIVVFPMSFERSTLLEEILCRVEGWQGVSGSGGVNDPMSGETVCSILTPLESFEGALEMCTGGGRPRFTSVDGKRG